MTGRELAIRQRLRDDFLHYAPRCLKIGAKAVDGRPGGIVPFVLNRAQLYLHKRLEDQRKRTGKVRALTLKGRQQGISTYLAARYYHKTTHAKGLRTFILAHQGDATENLFRMVQRYHENCPALVRPHTKYSSKKELKFDLLDSGYTLGTAGSKQVGRSSTVHLFHGSEVAFWVNAAHLAAGMLQTIPDLPGTEIVFESTANGIGGFFHEQWQAAEAGESEFEAIFIPWFWQPEYRREIDSAFVLTADEAEYMKLHGLDLEQMAWRREKIKSLNNDALLFMQEYPATPAEAFQMTGHESFITPESVMRARRHEVVEPVGPMVAGVDPARFGKDSTAVILRRGRKAFGLKRYHGKDTMEVVGICRIMLDRIEPRIDMMFIDVGGLGAGVVDRLRELGYSRRITAVNFGGKPLKGDRYKNKRAEMWGESREWLSDEDMPADIPDDDALHADAIGPGYSYDSEGRVVLESKDDMKTRGLRSPDGWDALALTFAFPVRNDSALRQTHADSSNQMFIKQPSAARQARAD